MSVSVSTTNKPLNPRAQDLSPKGYNRAALYSGKALDFDGVNDDITIPNSDSINITGDALTIAGYINTDGSTAWQAICYKDSGNQKGFQLFVDKTGDPNIAFGIHTGGFYRLYSNEVIENNKWYFVVATYDGVNQSIYINGVFDNSQAATGNITDSSAENLYIGRNTIASERFNGEMSGFKIFNTALTAAQVSDLYLNPEKIVPDGVADSALKLWLPMMEGAGTTAYDGSGNGNHGTISGATWVSGIGAPVAQTALVSWNKGVNVFTYSEQFDNAAWTKVSTTITANSIVSPDGYQNADKAEAFSSSQLISQTPSLTAGQPFVFSVFAKAGNWGIIRIGNQASGTNGAWFNLNTGTAGTINGGTSEIIDYGNGWFRLIAKFSSFVSGQCFIGISDADGSTTTPAVGSNLYLWGASLTQSSSVQPYIPTLATAQTSPVLLPQGLTANKDITGVNAFESARNPYALNLDGASWAEVHDNASLDFGTGSFTMEVWVRVAFENTGSSYNSILTLGSGVSSANTSALSTTSGINLLGWYNAYSSVSSVMTEGDWAHILGTYDGTNYTLYLNGAQVDQDARAAVNITNADVKMIGRDSTTFRYYQDQIALPRIYNLALTATEVARNYNADKSKFGL